ncbi:hypothetical protein C0W42_18535 [Photobacterium kishitanii]|nr:hypothetical protein C0W42_18535 [Photobacterium kishitanii]
MTDNGLSAYQPNPVIPYSEVTNEIGNLLTIHCVFKLKILLPNILIFVIGRKPETKWQVPDFVITIGIHK